MNSLDIDHDFEYNKDDMQQFITLPKSNHIDSINIDFGNIDDIELLHQRQFLYMSIEESPVLLFNHLCILLSVLPLVRPKYINNNKLTIHCLIADNVTEFDISIHYYYNKQLSTHYVLPYGHQAYIMQFTFINGDYIMYISICEYIERVLLATYSLFRL